MKHRKIILIPACLFLSLKAESQLSGARFHQLLNQNIGSWWIYGGVLLVAAGVAYWIIHSLYQRLKEERIVSAFATSLYGQKTVEDVFWDIAKNCVERFGFIDCVVYQLDTRNGVLQQKAAFGPKNPWRREIINQIEIPLGKGVVGSVAQTGRAEIIRNTATDPRYIVDDERRLSEITVPVWIDGLVFGVIDSEHPKRNFYRKYHLRLLKKIAAIGAERIAKYLSEEKLRSKIARDLHDEIGSTLTSINILSKVAMQDGVNGGAVKLYLQKIKDNSQNIMERMSDIVWAINPVNDSFDKVVLRMKEFAAEMLDPAGINYFFSEEGAIETTLLKLDHRKDIYLIFKEALNNLVKYSKATEVNIVLHKDGEKLKMTIIDNGCGFDVETVTGGNGIKNMYSRALDMQGSLNVNSIVGTGTTVVMEIAIT